MVLIAGDGFSVAPLASERDPRRGSVLPVPERPRSADISGAARTCSVRSSCTPTPTVGGARCSAGSLETGAAAAGEACASFSTRALGAPDDQTVLEVRGGAQGVGHPGRVVVRCAGRGVPENAFDGDPRTSWQFGDFGTRGRARASASSGSPGHGLEGDASRMRCRPGRHLARRVGDRRHVNVNVDVAPDGSTAIADAEETEGTQFTLTVLATEGVGFNRVGVSEIGLGSYASTRVARLPLTLSHLVRDARPDGRGALEARRWMSSCARDRGARTVRRRGALACSGRSPSRTPRAYRSLRPGVGPGGQESEEEADLVAGVDPP